jgi:hypothetical protein
MNQRFFTKNVKIIFKCQIFSLIKVNRVSLKLKCDLPH